MNKNFPAKTYQIHFRVGKNDYEAIRKNAAKAGLSISEYARRAMAGEVIVEAPPADYYQLILLMKRAGGNINTLLRKLNVLGIAHSLELERCQKDLGDAVTMLYETFRPEMTKYRKNKQTE